MKKFVIAWYDGVEINQKIIQAKNKKAALVAAYEKLVPCTDMGKIASMSIKLFIDDETAISAIEIPSEKQAETLYVQPAPKSSPDACRPEYDKPTTWQAALKCLAQSDSQSFGALAMRAH